MKGKIIFYGNCQMETLGLMLRQHDEYRFKVKIYKVHDISTNDIDILIRYITKDDILIYQHITEKYRSTHLYATSRFDILPCLKIKCPNLYFEGYFPSYGYMYTKFFNEHIYVDGMCFVDLSFLFPDRVVKDPTEENIKELKRRDIEHKVDIQVTDYIEKWYKHKLLFYTVNHPSYDLIYQVFTRLCKILGIEELPRYPDFAFDDVILPVCPMFEVSFPANKVYWIHGKPMSEKETLGIVEKFKTLNDEVFEYNKRIRESKFIIKN